MSAIITGVDGSEPAATAAATAAKLAFALGTRLVVVCAYEKLEYHEVDTGDQHIEFTSEDEAQEVANRAVAPLAELYPGLKVKGEARQGKPADALLASADANGAATIVVGNKRVQGVSRLLGSVATEVLRKATCDVYIAYTHQRP
ncbi:MAG: universal stress protein [Nocardioides sp.]